MMPRTALVTSSLRFPVGDGFSRLAARLHVPPEHRVDPRLIAAALLAEKCKDIVVELD